MNEHDSGDGSDYDDWFDEPVPPEPRRRGGRRAASETASEDSWTMPPPRERPPEHTHKPISVGGRTLTPTQLVIAVVSVIVLLLAILAAAGVFSGSTPKATTLPTTPTVTTPATTQPTQTGTTPTTTTPAVKVPTTTLKPGDTGPEVVLLQKALTAVGYSPGSADGTYGPATKQAVTNFQTAAGLTADGVAGPETLAAMKTQLAAKHG